MRQARSSSIWQAITVLNTGKKTGYHWPILLVILANFLVACASPAPTLPSPPTPQVVRIALSPTLASFTKSIYACADSISGLAVFIEEIPAFQEEKTAFDLTITYGLPSGTSTFTYQINEEQLHILVNSSNPVKEITRQTLVGIYLGTIKQWDEVDPLAGFHQPIQVVNYPPDSDLGNFFSRIIFPQATNLAEALIVPTPGAMLEQVAKQTGAIGYAPSSWMSGTDSVRMITTDPQLTEDLRQPILVNAKQKPQGRLAALLNCLQ